MEIVKYYKFYLKKGNKIYLLTKNIRIKKLNKKLNYIKIGLFLVKKSIKTKDPTQIINYKFKLPKNVKILLIFYILLLKLTNPNIFL